ncbi:MAG: hypothetical protein JJU41_02230 [Bacteroidetes bacterium]|nr:hypothetical protein [Bacteroidota bacterium]MCH8523283.1 hypothetical protein [Balneolales bacterium]
MSDFGQSITLKTEWRYYRKLLLISILLIPVYGIGLLFLILLSVKLATMKYQISSSGVSHGNTFLPFSSVKTVKVEDFRVLKSGNIATVVVTGNNTVLKLYGVRDASALQVKIENEVQALIERQRLEERLNRKNEPMPAGNMERLNDLVGLWQQGLITDQQYEEEKKKMIS